MAEINNHRCVENKYDIYIYMFIYIYIINIIHNEFMLYTSQICFSIIGTEEAFSRNTEKSKREPLKYVLCTQILVIK